MADTTFITNDSEKKLKDRIAELIGHSKELKFLVGFFYFSGIRELYSSLKNNPDICFEIDIPGDLINSEKACSWSMNYRSLMGEGKVIFISDEDEKADALNIIMGHYSGNTNWDINMKMIKNTSVFKVKIGSVSAKRSGI